jgi:GMP synthase (glutamine-hydrolysing)
LYESHQLPPVESFDMLIVMGGPMGVYDEDKYPWLRKEKLLIKNAAEKGKIILGICLGSQLLAEILGSRVYKNKYKEIGWFPVYFTKEARDNPLFNFFPNELNVFHWHGDTYDLPEGSVPLAFSEGCKNQGFILNNHLTGIQFHLEVTSESLSEMIKGSDDELIEENYVQTADQILKMISEVGANNAFMFELLDRMENFFKEKISSP